MWDKPEEAWPPLIKLCLELWVELNPGWNVEIYDLPKARSVVAGDIDMDIFNSLKVQHQSDLLRTKLLSTRGGVWADASCLPHFPVDQWIGDFESNDFSGIPALSQGQKCDNWFMISKENGFLLSIQYRSLIEYWRTPKINLPQDERSITMIAERWQHFISDFAAHELRVAPYFLWHYLFRRNYEVNSEFSSCFDAQKYLSMTGGCGEVIRMLRANFDAGTSNNPMPGELRSLLETTDAQLSKLNHHSYELNYPIDDFRSCILKRNSFNK